MDIECSIEICLIFTPPAPFQLPGLSWYELLSEIGLRLLTFVIKDSLGNIAPINISRRRQSKKADYFGDMVSSRRLTGFIHRVEKVVITE
jgi:hypothetical protein